MFSLRTGELVTAELMFLKEVLEVVDSFPAREIIAMCMNSDWSGSTYIMEHEPDKYDKAVEKAFWFVVGFSIALMICCIAFGQTYT